MSIFKPSNLRPNFDEVAPPSEGENLTFSFTANTSNGSTVKAWKIEILNNENIEGSQTDNIIGTYYGIFDAPVANGETGIINISWFELMIRDIKIDGYYNTMQKQLGYYDGAGQWLENAGGIDFRWKLRLYENMLLPPVQVFFNKMIYNEESKTQIPIEHSLYQDELVYDMPESEETKSIKINNKACINICNKLNPAIKASNGEFEIKYSYYNEDNSNIISSTYVFEGEIFEINNFFDNDHLNARIQLYLTNKGRDSGKNIEDYTIIITTGAYECPYVYNNNFFTNNSFTSYVGKGNIAGSSGNILWQYVPDCYITQGLLDKNEIYEDTYIEVAFDSIDYCDEGETDTNPFDESWHNFNPLINGKEFSGVFQKDNKLIIDNIYNLIKKEYLDILADGNMYIYFGDDICSIGESRDDPSRQIESLPYKIVNWDKKHIQINNNANRQTDFEFKYCRFLYIQREKVIEVQKFYGQNIMNKIVLENPLKFTYGGRYNTTVNLPSNKIFDDTVYIARNIKEFDDKIIESSAYILIGTLKDMILTYNYLDTSIKRDESEKPPSYYSPREKIKQRQTTLESNKRVAKILSYVADTGECKLQYLNEDLKQYINRASDAFTCQQVFLKDSSTELLDDPYYYYYYGTMKVNGEINGQKIEDETFSYVANITQVYADLGIVFTEFLGGREFGIDPCIQRYEVTPTYEGKWIYSSWYNVHQKSFGNMWNTSNLYTQVDYIYKTEKYNNFIYYLDQDYSRIPYKILGAVDAPKMSRRDQYCVITPLDWLQIGMHLEDDMTKFKSLLFVGDLNKNNDFDEDDLKSVRQMIIHNMVAKDYKTSTNVELNNILSDNTEIAAFSNKFSTGKNMGQFFTSKSVPSEISSQTELVNGVSVTNQYSLYFDLEFLVQDSILIKYDNQAPSMLKIFNKENSYLNDIYLWDRCINGDNNRKQKVIKTVDGTQYFISVPLYMLSKFDLDNSFKLLTNGSLYPDTKYEIYSSFVDCESEQYFYMREKEEISVFYEDYYKDIDSNSEWKKNINAVGIDKNIIMPYRSIKIKIKSTVSNPNAYNRTYLNKYHVYLLNETGDAIIDYGEKNIDKSYIIQDILGMNSGKTYKIKITAEDNYGKEFYYETGYFMVQYDFTVSSFLSSFEKEEYKLPEYNYNDLSISIPLGYIKALLNSKYNNTKLYYGDIIIYKIEQNQSLNKDCPKVLRFYNIDEETENIKDYNISTLHSYKYIIETHKSNVNYYNIIESNYINIKDNNWAIADIFYDLSASEYKIKDDIFIFGNNTTVNTINNNLNITKYKTLSKYDKVVQFPQKFESGSTTFLFGDMKCSQKIDTGKYQIDEKLMKFDTSNTYGYYENDAVVMYESILKYLDTELTSYDFVRVSVNDSFYKNINGKFMQIPYNIYSVNKPQETIQLWQKMLSSKRLKLFKMPNGVNKIVALSGDSSKEVKWDSMGYPENINFEWQEVADADKNIITGDD